MGPAQPAPPQTLSPGSMAKARRILTVISGTLITSSTCERRARSTVVAGSFEGMFCIVPDGARRRPRTFLHRSRQHPDARGRSAFGHLSRRDRGHGARGKLPDARGHGREGAGVGQQIEQGPRSSPSLTLPRPSRRWARRSFVAPRNVAEEDRLLVGKADYRGRPIIRELLVVNQRGEWKRASLPSSKPSSRYALAGSRRTKK